MSTPEPENHASALEELRQRLYRNAPPAVSPSATSFSGGVGQSAPEPVAWQQESVAPKKKRIAASVMFLMAAVVIFCGAIAVAAYFLVFGGGAISTDHVSISVAPMPSLRSGDVATLLVTVRNDNPTAMTSTRLSIVFPETARSADDPLVPYPRYEDTVGDVPPGGEVTRTVRAVLSGAEGETFSLPLKLEYKTEGSNAVFVKEDTHEVMITSSPLSVRVVVPPQATAGQEIALQVVVRSEATVPMENLAVSAEYPFGFIPAKTGLSTTLFDVGTLAPGKESTVTVRGTLSGEDSDERVFRFKVGTKGVGGSLGITYASGQGSIGLSHPFLATTFSVSGNPGTDLVIPVAQTVPVYLQWANTLASDVVDGEVTVKLSGDALDPTSISTSGGFYRSIDSTIVYARDTIPSLARMTPGATGNGSFSFSTKSKERMQTMRNPVVTAVITVSGRTSKDGGTPAPISATMTRTIQVGTNLGFTARTTRSTGPFTNTGPIPPQPNVESTYTVLMNFTATVNSIAGATMKGVLPSYVRFVGATSPSDGSITYDAATRTVTWAAGEVPAGSEGSPKQGAFQVAIVPSTSQQGTSPVLMSSISYNGTDRFTKRLLDGTVYNVTTQTLGDPGYLGAQGEVAK